jgi:hypothetical protein
VVLEPETVVAALLLTVIQLELLVMHQVVVVVAVEKVLLPVKMVPMAEFQFHGYVPLIL